MLPNSRTGSPKIGSRLPWLAGLRHAHPRRRRTNALLAADAQSVNGLLYNGNTTRRNMAHTVFSAINEVGGL